MNNHPTTPISDPSGNSAPRKRHWLLASLYWTGQGIYGLLAALICYALFTLAAAVSVAHLPLFPPVVANFILGAVVVLSLLVGVQAAYRNHRWNQRREITKRHR